MIFQSDKKNKNSTWNPCSCIYIYIYNMEPRYTVYIYILYSTWNPYIYIYIYIFNMEPIYIYIFNMEPICIYIYIIHIFVACYGNIQHRLPKPSLTRWCPPQLCMFVEKKKRELVRYIRHTLIFFDMFEDRPTWRFQTGAPAVCHSWIPVLLSETFSKPIQFC